LTLVTRFGFTREIATVNSAASPGIISAGAAATVTAVAERAVWHKQAEITPNEHTASQSGAMGRHENQGLTINTITARSMHATPFATNLEPFYAYLGRRRLVVGETEDNTPTSTTHAFFGNCFDFLCFPLLNGQAFMD
jgi:hypothetical protein